MNPTEALLQVKGKAPELVTVYKIDYQYMEHHYSSRLYPLLFYVGSGGEMGIHREAGGSEARIVFGRTGSGYNWEEPGDPRAAYVMMKDIIDGWTPLNDGWAFAVEGREVTIRDTGNDSKEIRKWVMYDEPRRAYQLGVASWNMPDCLKPII